MHFEVPELLRLSLGQVAFLLKKSHWVMYLQQAAKKHLGEGLLSEFPILVNRVQRGLAKGTDIPGLRQRKSQIYIGWARVERNY
jgi:hypothetical protein